MNKQGKITLALALFYSVGLLGFVGYNLADTFLITHVSAEEDDSTSATTSTGTSAATTNSSATTNSTATSTTSGNESSPYSATSVSYSKKSAKNSDNVSTPYYVADIKLINLFRSRWLLRQDLRCPGNQCDRFVQLADFLGRFRTRQERSLRGQWRFRLLQLPRWPCHPRRRDVAEERSINQRDQHQ
jgi:hypothetical protein